MDVVFAIIRGEILLLMRDRTFVLLVSILLLLVTYTITTGNTKYKAAYQQRQEVTQALRTMFLSQGEKNAHSAAHYGHIVFKPSSFLTAIDPGVQPFTGNLVRLEAHTQNDAIFMPASSQSSIVRFGELSFALMLQVVFPLLIIFSCYRSIIQDRQNGTLRILVSQGVTMRKLIAGKVIAYATIFLLFLFIATALYSVVIYSGDTDQLIPGLGLRLVLLFLLHAVYYFIIIFISVWFSAKAASPSGLLVGLLGMWFLFTIILPKATANIGAQQASVQSRTLFETQVNEESRKGVDGHNPLNERSKRLKDSLVKAYGVDSVNQLPIKASALAMQAEEEYRNMVYDRAIEAVKDTVGLQNSITSFASFADPFLAVKNLSMALCGSDVDNHFLFMQQAEEYRRKLIKRLNYEDAYGTGKVAAGYWDKIPDFTYVFPGVGWSLSTCKRELAALACWLIALLTLLYAGANKINAI